MPLAEDLADSWPEEDESVTAEIVPGPEPIWYCQACPWKGPSRELEVFQYTGGSRSVHCPNCETTEISLKPKGASYDQAGHRGDPDAG